MCFEYTREEQQKSFSVRRYMGYRILPDYLNCGADNDFLRIPLTSLAAIAIAQEYACILPACKMVSDSAENNN